MILTIYEFPIRFASKEHHQVPEATALVLVGLLDLSPHPHLLQWLLHIRS
jgi:hypothetical protein